MLIFFERLQVMLTTDEQMSKKMRDDEMTECCQWLA
jgi:hypothetical protein